MSATGSREVRHDLCFVHTAQVHVSAFDALAQRLAPELRVRHVVRTDLLSLAQTRGADDTDLVRQVHDAMTEAASSGAAVVVCTCSTIGGAAENTLTTGQFVAARIDRAMADEAVRRGPNVLLVAALESTLQPTRDLLETSARTLALPVDVTSRLVPDAWASFTSGDARGYINAITSAVRAWVADDAFRCSVVVLAQASMAPAADALADLGYAVLSSPELGVRHAIAKLTSQRGQG